MDSVIVDTDVVSFIFKSDSREALYKPHLDGKRVCVAFMTVAEAYRWAVSRKWGARRIAEPRQELDGTWCYPTTTESLGRGLR